MPDAFIDTMEAGGVRSSLNEVAAVIDPSSFEALDTASALRRASIPVGTVIDACSGPRPFANAFGAG